MNHIYLWKANRWKMERTV